MVCLITGASRGLGKAIALRSGELGWKVAVHYRQGRSNAENVAGSIDESFVIPADVRVKEDVDALIAQVVQKWGRIDVVVNNAGVTRESLLLRTGEADFDEIIDTNLKGPFQVIRAAARVMMKQKVGHIVNISSYAGQKGKEGLSAYAASKAGLIGLTKTAARELSRYGICVNAVLPGYMMTDMGHDSSEKGKAMALKESLVKDYSDPAQVAQFVCRLVEMKGVTGQVFNLDSRIL